MKGYMKYWSDNDSKTKYNTSMAQDRCQIIAEDFRILEMHITDLLSINDKTKNVIRSLRHNFENCINLSKGKRIF